MKQLRLLIVAIMLLGHNAAAGEFWTSSTVDTTAVLTAEYALVPDDYVLYMRGKKSKVDTSYQFRYFIETPDTTVKYLDMAFYYYFPDELLPKISPLQEKVIISMTDQF